MRDALAQRLLSPFVFAMLLASLFLFFTPFEQADANPTMLPKYLVAGAALALLAPVVVLTPLRLTRESVLVLGALATIVFHTAVVKPGPAQFNLLIACNVVLAIILYELHFRWPAQFASALSWLLLVNAAVITLQAALFRLTSGPIFDFHKAIFGSDSRFVEDFLNIARFSGLQVEPGTYANYMACLLAILLLAAPYSRRLVWIAFVAVMSIFLTNSGSSVYFVPLLIAMLALLWRRRVRVGQVVLLLVAVGAYVYFSGIAAHVEDRFLEHDDGSLSHRIDGVNTYLVASVEEKLIGFGFASDPCVRCFYQDIGVTFNLVTRGGMLVTLALALIGLRTVAAHGVWLGSLLLLIPLNEKMSFYEAPIWLLLLFAMHRRAAAGVARTPAAPLPRLTLARQHWQRGALIVPPRPAQGP